MNLFLIRKYLGLERKISYAQSGEDVIVDYVLSWMKIQKPTYLDIGAHHPTWLSNTYFFYKKGCRGVCIEPDPELWKMIKRWRKNDVCLNIGVGIEEQTIADFYIMSQRTLNTFSLDEVGHYTRYYKDCKVEKIIPTKLIPINDLMRRYFKGAPNFLSVDVEGMDAQVLSSIDFDTFRPEVVCVETVTYLNGNTLGKSQEVQSWMRSKEYFVYADTFINTIFVDHKAWSTRGLPGLENLL